MDKLAKASCVEIIKPKTVPPGLVAWGTVCHVTDHIIKIQITGGITCTIDKANVSQVYCDLIESYNQKILKNPDNKSIKHPTKLTKLFNRGEQYVCKILDNSVRKNNPNAQFIAATLEPSAIFEDVIPAIYFAIPNAPIQCVVKSVEDHGYQMDIGFKNRNGFLNVKETNGAKLIPGQVVRCCLKNNTNLSDESRTVPLSMSDKCLSLSHYKHEKVESIQVNDNCILPGSQSFCTVLGVKQEGLLVNLMNEFPAFVSADNLKNEWDVPKENYKISDKFDCTILYYNPTTKAFALSLRPVTRMDDTREQIMEHYKLGHIVENAKVMYIAGTKGIYFKLDNNYKAIASVKDALDTDPGTMTKDEQLNALDQSFPQESKHKVKIKSINMADLILAVGISSKMTSFGSRHQTAMLREASIRKIENELIDPDRTPQSIQDFERILLKNPNSADFWIKYSNFFLDNVETEKARIVCGRALKTINFRSEKEKLQIWLHLIRIEAKYGGSDRLHETIAEAAKLNEPQSVYRGAARVLLNCNQPDEADRIYQLLIKANKKSVDVMIEYIQFLMEQRKDLDLARSTYENTCKLFNKSDLINFQSRFARLEFKSGDVERGKTIFENILNENPKKTDLWRVYQDMIRKFGTRLVDNDQARQQNEETLKRIAESIDTVQKKPNATKRKKQKQVSFAKSNPKPKKLKTAM